MATLHKTGNISPKKGETKFDKFRVDFDEMFFEIDGDKAFIWAYAHSTDAYDYSDTKFPTQVTIELDKTKGDSQALVHKILGTLDSEKCYSGFYSLDDSFELAKQALEDENAFNLLQSTFLQAVEVEAKNLKKAELKRPQPMGGKKGGYVDPVEAATKRHAALQKVLGQEGSLVDLAEFIHVQDSKETLIQLVQAVVR